MGGAPATLLPPMILSCYLLLLTHHAMGYATNKLNDADYIQTLMLQDVQEQGRNVEDLLKDPDISRTFVASLVTNISKETSVAWNDPALEEKHYGELDKSFIPMLSNIHLRLIAHLLLWSKHLGLQLRIKPGDLDIDSTMFTGKLVLTLLDMFDLGLDSDSRMANLLGKEKVAESISLRTFLIFHGDSVLSGLKLGDKTMKLGRDEETHPQLINLEGETPSTAIKTYVKLLRDAMSQKQFEGYGTMLSHLDWQLRFALYAHEMARMNGEKKNYHLIHMAARLLIRELPSGNMNLLFYLDSEDKSSRHAQFISFHRDASDSYGFKIFNSGLGINNHMSTEMLDASVKYSPFLGFKDISWKMLSESFLIGRVMKTNTQAIVYQGMTGLFSYLGKRWTWENYLDYAKSMEGKAQVYPKLIMTQRSGTCTRGAIKAVEVSFLQDELYRDLNAYFKIQQSLEIIKLRSKNWIEFYRSKADVRYTLLGIVRNVARRMKRGKFGGSELLMECIAAIDSAAKHKAEPQSTFKLAPIPLQEKKPSTEFRSKLAKEPRFGSIVFPDWNAPIRNIDDILKRQEQIRGFFRSHALPNDYKKIFWVQYVGDLPLLKEADFTGMDPITSRAKLTIFLYVSLKILAETYDQDYSAASKSSFDWDLSRFQRTFHHYTALSEEFFFAGKGERPSSTLSDCYPQLSLGLFEKITLDQKSKLAFAGFQRKPLCASIVKNEEREDKVMGGYVESMKLWLPKHFPDSKIDVSKVPPIAKEEAASFENPKPGEVEAIVAGKPSVLLELYFYLTLQQFIVHRTFIQPLEKMKDTYERTLHNSLDVNGWCRSFDGNGDYSDQGKGMYPIKFSSMIEFHDYLATNSLIGDVVFFLLASTQLNPLETSDTSLARSYASRRMLTNPINMPKLFEKIKENALYSIDSMLKRLEEKPMENSYHINLYLTALLNYEIQSCSSTGDLKRLRQFIAKLEDFKEKLTQATNRGMLGRKTDSVGSLKMIILAGYRGLIEANERVSPSQRASDLLWYAKAYKEAKETSLFNLHCPDYVVHYGNLGLYDLFKSAHSYQPVLKSSPETVKALLQLDSKDVEEITSVDSSKFPLVTVNETLEFSLFLRERAEFVSTSEFEFQEKTQSTLKDEKGSFVQFHRANKFTLAFKGLDYFGEVGNFSQRYFLDLYSEDSGIIIGTKSKEIWLEWNLNDHLITAAKWLPDELAGEKLYLIPPVDIDQKIQHIFKYCSKEMHAIGIGRGDQRPIISILGDVMLEGGQVMIVYNDGKDVRLLPLDRKEPVLEFVMESVISDGPDLQKFPVVCKHGGKECFLLLPKNKKDLLYPIPITKSVGKYTLAPKSRRDILLVLYRLIKTNVVEAVARFSAMIEFETPLSNEERELLSLAFESGGWNPDIIATKMILVQRAMEGNGDQKAASGLKSTLKMLINASKVHEGNMEAKGSVNGKGRMLQNLRFKMTGPFNKRQWLQAAQLTLKTAEFPNFRRIMDYPTPRCSLPSIGGGQKESKHTIDWAEMGSKKDMMIRKQMNGLDPSLSSLSNDADDQFFFKPPTPIENAPPIEDAPLVGDFILNAINVEGEGVSSINKILMHLLGGSQFKCFKHDLPNIEEVQPHLLLVNHPPSTYKLQGSGDLYPDTHYWNLNIKTLNEPGLDIIQQKLSKAEENLGSTWSKCLGDVSLVGHNFTTWKLMKAGDVKQIIEMVKMCLARGEMDCVRDVLGCQAIENSFLAYSTEFMRLSFILSYHENRFPKLTTEEKEFELKKSNKKLIGFTGRYLTWQYASSYVLYKTQVSDVGIATTLQKDGSYPEVILQRIMASGKTYTLGPLITHGKADGFHLPVLIVPTALFEMNSADLLTRQKKFFGQDGMSLKFDRLVDFSNHDYLTKLLSQMTSIIADRGYIVTAPESIQAMENSFIEMLDPETGVSQMNLDAMRMILRLLRSRGTATIDEIDTIFNPKKELNYPTGKKEDLDPVYIYMSALLQYILILSPPDNVNESLLTRFMKLIKVSPWRDNLHLLESLDTDFVATSPRQAGTKDDYHLIMWQQVHEWIPAGTQVFVNEHYGRSIEHPNYWLAKPFKSANVPSEESEFSNPFEILNRTFAMYFYKGLDEAQFEPFMWFILENAENPSDAKDMLGLSRMVDLTNISQILGSYNHALHTTSSEHHSLALTFFLRYLAEIAIPRDLQYFRRSIKSNALSMASRFKRIMGYSGTLPNSFVFPERLRSGIKWDFGANKQITDRLLVMSDPIRVVDTKKKSLEEMIAEIAGPASPTKRALIDIGALFKDHSNTEVAEALLKQWRQTADVILFFYPVSKDPLSNKIVAFRRKNQGDEVELIKMNGTEMSKIEEVLGENVKYIVYFDQWHTTGVDIPLPIEAKGVATIGLKTTIRDFAQGVMRMRKFLGKQTIEVVVDSSVQTDLTMAGAIKYTEDVAKQLKRKENLQLAFSKLKNEIRASILDMIISRRLLNLKDASDIFKKIEKYLVSHEPEIAILYGGQMVECDLITVLKSLTNGLLKECESLIKNGLVDERLPGRLIQIEGSVKKIYGKSKIEKAIKVKRSETSILGMQQGNGGEQQRLNLQEQEEELEQVQENEAQRLNHLMRSQADFHPFPDIGLQFTSDGLKVNPNGLGMVQKYHKIELHDGLLPFKTIATVVRPEVSFDCVSDKLFITLDFVFMVNKFEYNSYKQFRDNELYKDFVKLTPVITLWDSLQRQVTTLLWIESGKDQRLVIISPDEAAGFVHDVKQRNWSSSVAKIALIDLKGTVFLSSDPSRWKEGDPVEHPELPKLLREVALLFGSYPMISKADFDDWQDPEKFKCYGSILKNVSLKDVHKSAFISDRKLSIKFDFRASVKPKRMKVDFADLYKIPVKPSGVVTLCSSKEELFGALYYKSHIGVSCGGKEFEKINTGLGHLHDLLLTDRRIDLNFVDKLLHRVMVEFSEIAKDPHDADPDDWNNYGNMSEELVYAAIEVMKHKEKSDLKRYQGIRDRVLKRHGEIPGSYHLEKRVIISSAIKHWLNIKSLVQFLRIEQTLPAKFPQAPRNLANVVDSDTEDQPVQDEKISVSTEQKKPKLVKGQNISRKIQGGGSDDEPSQG